MVSEVFVVYKHVLGACEALFVYAICTTRYRARKVRRKVGFLKGKKFYDVDPATSPYASELRILKVQADRLYRLGLFSGPRHSSEEVIV